MPWIDHLWHLAWGLSARTGQPGVAARTGFRQGLMVLRTLGFSVTIQLFTHMLVLVKNSLKAAFLGLGFPKSIRKHPPRPQVFSSSSCDCPGYHS